MKKYTLLITLIFISMLSCAKKTLKTDINVDFSQLVVGNYDGGIILYGASESGDSIIRVLNGTQVTTDLTPGVWNFHVIAWDNSGVGGSEYFQGVVKCGKNLGVDLRDSNKSINISIADSIDNCSAYGNYGSQYFLNPAVTILSDDSGACDVETGTNCGPPPVTVQTMRLSIKSLNFFSGNLTELSDTIHSACLDVTAFSTNPDTTFPMKKMPGVFALAGVEIFTNTNCNTANSNEKRFHFLGRKNTKYSQPDFLKLLF